ncbi:hypothetical protein H2509_13615 [Stappia sp. F7233]|uniref:Uncharacterized protein n=1 Tax=Stappia albiluteola TaxID=2758565 RepID=A0A839AGY4_9HYPH|nr:hypothetical protein [Stappia albiluteola]MBA5778162.1 hypothetical protein [Stappia albiluteola]
MAEPSIEQAENCTPVDHIDEVSPVYPKPDDWILTRDGRPYLKGASWGAYGDCFDEDVLPLAEGDTVEFCFATSDGRTFITIHETARQDGGTATAADFEFERSGATGSLYWIPGDPDTINEDPVEFMREQQDYDPWHDDGETVEFEAYTLFNRWMRLTRTDAGEWTFREIEQEAPRQ